MNLMLHLVVFALLTAAASGGPLATKGELLLSDDFASMPADRKPHKFGLGWKRKISFGAWAALKDGGVQAANIPEQGHGPVLTYLGPVKDVIIECEFRLPAKEGPDRHFRIFLDHPDYRGHNIAAWANLATKFQPLGLTLLHNPKTADKKVMEEVRFGPEAIELTPDVWHRMRLEVVGRNVRVTVGEVVVSGSHPRMATTRNKIGLNPGKAGGTLRNFRMWTAIPAN